MVEKYLWENKTRLLAVYDGSGNLKQRYEYALGNTPASYTEGGNRYYILTDQLGSPRMVTDEDGTLLREIEYDSFGNIVADSAPEIKLAFGFAGGLYDTDTGLIRFGYRDYDPETGRWTARDPIGFAGGDTNLYAYVHNNPLSFIDPTGLAVGDWWDFPANINRAEEIAREELARPGHGGHNDSSDANRHAEWSRRMCEETNSFTSWGAGVFHELDGLINGQPWNEFMMDMHNNQEGRNAASDGRPVIPGNLITNPGSAGTIFY